MTWQIKDVMQPAFDGPLLDNQYVKAGLFIVKTITQRNNLKIQFRRIDGATTTMVFVSDTNQLFKLVNEPGTTTTTDGDWENISIGFEGGGLVPVGNWDAVANDPALTDTGAATRNGEFYFAVNAGSGHDVLDPNLFGGVLTHIENGDWIISIGTAWSVVRPTVTWEMLEKPASIDAYVAGTVIAHAHVVSDVTGLSALLDAKYGQEDTADHTIPFASVPDDKIVEVEFLKQHYYIKSEIDALVGGIVTDFLSLSDTPNSYTGQALKFVRVNAAGTALEFATPQPAWSDIQGKPTTVAGYAISDAVATGGSYSNPTWITSLAASKITGVLNISNIPAAALERVYVYVGGATEPELAGLTTNEVQNGDIVRINSTGEMFVVVNDAALSSASSFIQFNAGIAASVPWSGVTGTPTTVSGYGITDAWIVGGNDDSGNRQIGLLNNALTLTVKSGNSTAGTIDFVAGGVNSMRLTHQQIRSNAVTFFIANSTGDTITTDTRVDIRGVSSGAGPKILRIATSANTRITEFFNSGDISFYGSTTGLTTNYQYTTGNWAVGTSVLSDSKFVVKGSTSSNFGYTFRGRNSSDQDTLRVTDEGVIIFGNNGSGIGKTSDGNGWSVTGQSWMFSLGLSAINSGIPALVYNFGTPGGQSIAAVTGTMNNSSFNPSSGTASYYFMKLNHEINSTGTYAGNIFGIDYDPLLTSTTGAAHYAARFVSGNVLIGATSITANTKVDIRGNGTTTANILRLANSADVTRFTVTDNGVATFTGISGSTTLSVQATAAPALRLFGSINHVGILQSSGYRIIDATLSGTTSSGAGLYHAEINQAVGGIIYTNTWRISPNSITTAGTKLMEYFEMKPGDNASNHSGGYYAYCVFENTATPNIITGWEWNTVNGGKTSQGTRMKLYGDKLAIGSDFTPTSILDVRSSFVQSSGSTSFSGLSVVPTYNTTGTYAGTAIGINYDPILTSTTGLTHYAALFRSGFVGIGTGAPVTLFEMHNTVYSDIRRAASIVNGVSNTQGSLIVMRKHRNNAAVQNGDSIGQIYFEPYVSTSGYITGAGIYAVVNGTVNSTTAPTDLRFFTSAASGGSVDFAGETRMIITSAGLIGVGIDVPTSRLDVRASLTASSGTTGLTTFTVKPTYNTTGTYTGTAIGIDYDPVLTSTTGLTHLAIRVTSGGVLIGGTTITATTRLDVRGIASGIIARFADNSNVVQFQLNNDGTASIVGTWTAPTPVAGTNTTQIATTAFIQTEVNCTTDSGSVVSFDTPKIYGTPTVPITTNLTESNTGAKLGMTQEILHNNATEPTYPATWSKALDSADYVSSVLNIIQVRHYSTTVKIYRIFQPE